MRSQRWPFGYPRAVHFGRTVFTLIGVGDRMAAGRRRENSAFEYLGLKPPVRKGAAPMAPRRGVA